MGQEASRLGLLTGVLFPVSDDCAGVGRFAFMSLPEVLADTVDKKKAASPSKGMQWSWGGTNGAQGKGMAVVVLSWYSSSVVAVLQLHSLAE